MEKWKGMMGGEMEEEQRKEKWKGGDGGEEE